MTLGQLTGVHGDAFAARDVADDGLAANGIATARAVDQQVAVAFDHDGVASSPPKTRRTTLVKPPAWSALPRPTWAAAPAGRKLRQHLAGGILAVANAGHQVVGTAQSVVAGDSLQVGVLDVLQRDAVFARFFFDQLAADFNGALALVDVEPVLDLVARRATT